MAGGKHLSTALTPFARPGSSHDESRERAVLTPELLRLMLPSLLLRHGCLGLSRPGSRHQDVKSFFRRHFLFAALVPAILVFIVTGPAACFEDFFSHHRHDGVIGA